MWTAHLRSSSGNTTRSITLVLLIQKLVFFWLKPYCREKKYTGRKGGKGSKQNNGGQIVLINSSPRLSRWWALTSSGGRKQDAPQALLPADPSKGIRPGVWAPDDAENHWVLVGQCGAWELHPGILEGRAKFLRGDYQNDGLHSRVRPLHQSQQRSNGRRVWIPLMKNYYQPQWGL